MISDVDINHNKIDEKMTVTNYGMMRQPCFSSGYPFQGKGFSCIFEYDSSHLYRLIKMYVYSEVLIEMFSHLICSGDRIP